MRRNERNFKLAGILCAGACVLAAPARGAEPAPNAAEILRATAVEGGLIVHMGCGDGRLTAALRTNEKYAVQGLTADAGQLAEARRRIAALGLYGPVSVELLGGDRLPYTDNLVNLVVADDPGLVPPTEIMRVLAPLGVAYVRAAERWEKIVKPRPKDIDQWSHFLHDASNNAVALDARVGPPRTIQWVAPPLWLRSHETPSGIQSLVTSGGRLFYLFDEGQVGITDQRLPERWSLVARDAFNGKLLWTRPVEPWGWPQWARNRFQDQDWTTLRGARTIVPDENQRRLVADGDRVYATLGYRSALSILDAATGRVLATVKETEPVAEILASGNTVLVHRREPISDVEKRRGKPQRPPSTLVALDRDGKVLWKRDVGFMDRLTLAIDGPRAFFQQGDTLTGLDLADGKTLWKSPCSNKSARTLIAHESTVVVYAGKALEAFDAKGGQRLWEQEVPSSAGEEAPDLFVIDNLVWRGMVPVDAARQPVSKSADAMAVAYDLRSGQERRRVVACDLRSPEHHHRCYRNKATGQWIISGMEGAEFLNLGGDGHSQNNWLRGACRLGIMPANGLLYVPTDQCFCQPGAKLLGFAAVGAERVERSVSVPDAERLEKGPAYGQLPAEPTGADDWPTYRHDPARHATTGGAVAPKAAPAWRVKIGASLTAPVAVRGRIYVAARDAHTLYALDADSGKTLWTFTAGARIDSPPTVYEGMVLFGSADGRAYCLRAADGALAWRFLAAPSDCRIAYFDQFESVWPAHGSVLVRDGVAYVTAGRSTYLDGGIRLWGLDPRQGTPRYRTTLAGPFPSTEQGRELGFYVRGANSDVLVSEGDFLYMRQKKLTPELEEIQVPDLSTMGEQDVGLHVFSTAGMLDASGYNRTFWMYSRRWPGFQLANQAPKSGQLLVVDAENTYAVNPFYRRNVHSPMFFPAKEGYLLFADKNTTEPQIVGEEGARPPVAWLPQNHIPREGNPGLDSLAFGQDKKMGYTRAEAPLWAKWVSIRVQAMVKAGPVLFVAGPPDVLDPADPYAALDGRRGARLAAVSAADGAVLAEQDLDVLPTFDGMIAAGGRLLISLSDGSLACFQ